MLQSRCLILSPRVNPRPSRGAVCRISRSSTLCLPAPCCASQLLGARRCLPSPQPDRVSRSRTRVSSPSAARLGTSLLTGCFQERFPCVRITAARTAFWILSEQGFPKPFYNENDNILATKKIKGVLYTYSAPEVLCFNFNDALFIIIFLSYNFTFWLKLQGCAVISAPFSRLSGI